MKNAEQIKCINCNTVLTGKYCSACGQKRIEPKDKKLIYFFSELFTSFFFADGKIFATFKTILTKPGELSRVYISGNRKKYLTPLQLFFFANLLYFLFPIISTFNTSLSTQIKHLPYSDYVKTVVGERINEMGVSYEEYRETYEQLSSQNGKLLLIVLVILQAVIFKLLFIRNENFYFSDFIAASAYFNAIYIIFLLILLPSIVIGLNQIFDLEFNFINDTWLSIMFVVLVIAYLLVFVKRAFQVSFQSSFIKSVLLAICLIPSFIVYRFVLFWVTYWMV